MPNSGWVNLTTFANVTGIGTNAWNSPQNAALSDNNYANVGVANTTALSNYLRGLQLVASIPNNAIIDGIECRIERKLDQASAGGAGDYEVRLVKSGTIGGNNNGDNAAIPTADTYRTFGSPTDLWGRSWTFDDINASNFGTVYVVQIIADVQTNVVRVDHTQLKIYYHFDSDMFLTI